MNRHKLWTCAVVLILASASSAQEVKAPDWAPEGMEHPQLSPVDADSRSWLTGEYLMWWIKNGPAPVPLATSAPAGSTAFSPGALGNPDTSVVLGGRAVEHPLHHGGRFGAGLWLDDCQDLGIEGSYFFLADRTDQQSVAGSAAPGSPFLVNPFHDVSINQENANFLADPLGTAGTATLTNRSRMQGAECNLLANVLSVPGTRLQLLAGFRFLQLQEGLTFATTQTDPGAVFFPGQFVNTVDDFSTRNNFYGGQLGARFDYTSGRFFVQASAKVALGSTHEIVDINGYTTTNTGPAFQTRVPVATVPGGIYTQPTNIGTQSRNRFAVAPEATIQVGVNLGKHMRAFLGYNFLYVSEVARPGNQIDRSVNSTQLASFSGVPTTALVGQPRPAPLFNGSDFWAQGINFGLGFNW